MASVTHQALLMIGSATTTAAAKPGWERQLSGVPPSLSRDRFLQARADAASYRNNWLSPPRYCNPLYSDPYYASVVLQMGFEGADAATGTPGMDDESPAAHGTATVVGNAQIDTAQFKFGGSSLKLDGSGDRIQFIDSADWKLSSANSDQFTVECFVRFNSWDANSRGIMGQSTAVAGTLAWVLTGTAVPGDVGFSFSLIGTVFDTTLNTSGVGMTTGVWYHVAVDKDGSGTIRIYVDGVMKASTTPANSAIFDSANSFTIGAQGSTGAVDMDGWVDEVRITKGVARYATDTSFTVPTTGFPRSQCSNPAKPFGWAQPLPVAPRTRDTRLIDPSSYANAWLSPATAKDPYFANVVLLLGFPGADASTSVTDESTANNKGVAVASGNAQVDTAQSVFGGSSLLLDGSGDVLRWVDSPDYNLAAGAFTIECWIRPATVAAGTRFIVGQWFTAGDLGWVLYQFAGQLWFNVSVTGSDNFSDVGSPTLLSANTWYAVAIDFDGTKYRLYLNGVIVASSTTLRTIHNSSFDLAVGANGLGSGFFFNGWIDELRITKGVARYASDGGYTTAAAAFPRS